MHTLAGCYNNLGSIQGSIGERLEWFGKAIEVEEDNIRQNPSPNLMYQEFLATMLKNVGGCHCTAGNREAALKAYTREIEIRKETSEASPPTN